MRTVLAQLRRLAIFCHRWMGLAFCVLFAWWFASGIFTMYWDFPSVDQDNRLSHSEPIDISQIRLSPEEAFAKAGLDGSPEAAQLAMFDGRLVYRFTVNGGRIIVSAGDGSVQRGFPQDLLLRIASRWAGQPGGSARVEEITATDQWTVQGGLRNLRPLWKYSFPDGQQVYVSGRSGEVVQYTTRASRIGAELGPVAHWIYYTPLRLHPTVWSNLIIWASGIGTGMALLGLIAGLSLYSPSKCYRLSGAPTHVPYAGPKRLHMILGLFFGIVTCTWAFSGMLSMDPFPEAPDSGDSADSPAFRIEAALAAGPFHMGDYAVKTPRAALVELGGLKVKQLDFTSFGGQPVYLAALSPHDTRIVPVHGDPRAEYDRGAILAMVAAAARPYQASASVLTQYDRYYLDRHRELPLPLLLVRVSDPQHTQLYIDPRTAQIMEEHSDASSWVTRWLYHGLHSMNFPWLYNYRPAWDIVVLTLMLGGLSLCVTSVILAWNLMRRKLNLAGRK